MKIIKWIAIGIGCLVGVIFLALGIVYAVSSSKMNHRYSVVAHPVSVATDSGAIAYGKRLATVRGCIDCHGENLAGKLFMDAPPLVGKIYGSNLTSGKGGIGNQYTDTDWERAIRHAVNPEGKPLIFMPSHEFFQLSDEDLAALLAYLETLPPVDNELPQNSIGPIARLLYLKGDMPLVPAELIDHELAHPNTPKRGVNVEFGRYMAVGCMGCHGQDLTGGPIPGAPPDWPEAADLTPAGNLKNWTEQDFLQAVRTGIKPTGESFLPQMPVSALQAMTDEELRAIWLFLKSLPSRQNILRNGYSSKIP